MTPRLYFTVLRELIAELEARSDRGCAYASWAAREYGVRLTCGPSLRDRLRLAWRVIFL